MAGRCMCGDTRCSSCGPAQGNNRCFTCGKWDDEGGCDDSAACAVISKKEDEERERGYLTDILLGYKMKRWGEMSIEELREEKKTEKAKQ